MNSRKTTLILIFACCFFGLAAKAEAQRPTDVVRIIGEAAIEGPPSAMSGYSYKMEFTRVKRSVIGRSTLKRRYNALLPTRLPKRHPFQHPLLLVYDSRRKLRPTDIVGQRKRIIERLEAIEAETDQELMSDEPSDDGYLTLRADSNTVGEQALRIDLLQLLQTAKFSKLKSIEHNGRATYSLRFDPDPEKSYEEELFYLSQIEGTILIDKEDKRVVRVEGYPVGDLKKYGSKPENERAPYRALFYRQQRVQGGHWFPETAELNFLEYPYDFNRLAVKINFAFSEYTKFTAAVESHKLKTEDLVDDASEPPKTGTDH